MPVSSAFRSSPHSQYLDVIGLEPAGIETPLVTFNILEAKFGQTELPFLKFPSDQDKALRLSFAKCFQACAFRRRLPIHTHSAVQQYHYLYDFVSPRLMNTAQNYSNCAITI